MKYGPAACLLITAPVHSWLGPLPPSRNSRLSYGMLQAGFLCASGLVEDQAAASRRCLPTYYCHGLLPHPVLFCLLMGPLYLVVPLTSK